MHLETHMVRASYQGVKGPSSSWLHHGGTHEKEPCNDVVVDVVFGNMQKHANLHTWQPIACVSLVCCARLIVSVLVCVLGLFVGLLLELDVHQGLHT